MAQVPPNSTEPLGVSVLKSRGLFPEAHWYWIGVAALIGYIVLFNFLITLSLKYLNRKHHVYMLRSVFKLRMTYSDMRIYNLRQHLESLRQYYQKRAQLREILTELEHPLSYHQDQRNLLVNHLVLILKGLYLIVIFLTFEYSTIITVQKGAVKVNLVQQLEHHLQEC